MTSRLYAVAALCIVAAAVPVALWRHARRTFEIDVWEGSGL